MPNPTVEIRPYRGRPTLFIDGAPRALSGINPPADRDGLAAHIARFARHGTGVYIIHQHSHEFWVGNEIRDTPLPDEGSDEPTVDERAAMVLDADPEAYLMVRYTPHPPRSWSDLHRQEYSITEDGTTPGSPSLASDLFWSKVADVSAAIVRYLEARPWAHRLVGYLNFHIDEGTHRPIDLHWLYDHNPAMVACWRAHLRARYRDEDALRAAYGDDSLTFDAVPFPRDYLRGPVPEVSAMPYWQAGADNRPLRDYLELQRDLYHRRFRQVGAAMEAAVSRPVPVLYDCLKQTMAGWNLCAFFWEQASWSLAYPEVLAGSGHIAVADLFEAPGFDGLMTPLDYQTRGIGGACQTEAIADTVVLRGKYYFAEQDQRTSPLGDDSYGTPRTQREFAAVTWRNFADAWTRGYNSYLCGHFYEAAELHTAIGPQMRAMEASVDWNHETVPGIAMVLDDAAVLETSGAGNFPNEAVMWEQKLGLAHCGVPYRVYLLEDLALDTFPDHRVIYFPNLFRVDDERLALLHDKVFGAGRVVVWGPGSGISDGERIGPGSASRLTGFTFDMVPVNSQRRVLVTDHEHPATAGLEADTVLGGPLPYGPVLFPTDGHELGLAWTKWQCNHVGLALKEFGRGAGTSRGGARGPGDWASLFTVAVPLPARLWRSLARYAGAHVYCESNDIIMADSSVVALHSAQSGCKRLALPQPCRVLDVITGDEIGQGLEAIDFDLRAPETRVFRLEPVR